MAAKGLPDVVQKFIGENSAYLRALQENRDAIDQMINKIREQEQRLLASGQTEEQVAARIERAYQGVIDKVINAAEAYKAKEDAAKRAAAAEQELFHKTVAVGESMALAQQRGREYIQGFLRDYGSVIDAWNNQEKALDKQINAYDKLTTAQQAAQEKAEALQEQMLSKQVNAYDKLTAARVAAQQKADALQEQSLIKQVNAYDQYVAKQEQNLARVQAVQEKAAVALQAQNAAITQSVTTGVNRVSDNITSLQTKLGSLRDSFTDVVVANAAASYAMDSTVAQFASRGAQTWGGFDYAYNKTGIDTAQKIATDIEAAKNAAMNAASLTSAGSNFDSSASLTEMGRAMEAMATEAGFASYRDLMRASFGLGGGGGSLGGGGGGGGNFLGGLLSGNAGRDADLIAGWAGRVAPAVHYVTMAIAEFAATAIPAAVALSEAGIVGTQGAQQGLLFGKSLNTAVTALGPAWGISPTQALAYPGWGFTPKQQAAFTSMGNAVAADQGGVYQLFGQGEQILAGSGGSFMNSGTNTLAMIDRGTANFALNFDKPGGTGEKLQNALASGTSYLRSYADVLGNLGNLILGAAPDMPGIGQDWLTGLKGATGGLAWLFGSHGGGALGSGISDALSGGLAMEAGWRLGRPALGLLGKGTYGIAGLAEKVGLGTRGASAADVAALAEEGGISTEEALAAMGGFGGEGLAGLIGGLGAGAGLTGAAVTAPLALSGYLLDRLISASPSPTARSVSAMQNSLYGTAGFTTQFQPLLHALETSSGLAAQPETFKQQLSSSGATGFEVGRYGTPVAEALAGGTATQEWANAAQGFGTTVKNLVQDGPQLVSLLKGMGVQGVSMAQAFEVAQDSLLNLNSAFSPQGGLTATAKQQIKGYVTAIGPMIHTIPGLQAAVGATDILSNPDFQKLSTVNQSLDTMSQFAEGGPSGAAALFGLTGAAPVSATKAPTKAGYQLSAPPAFASLAQALEGFTSPTSAAAWSSVTNSQGGLLPTLEQNMDQLRTYMTEGAITQPQASAMAAYYMEQALPAAKGSPAMLALIEQQGMGIGGISGLRYYQTGPGAPGQNRQYQDTVNALGAAADSTKQFTKNMNEAVEASSNTPEIAQNFTASLAPSMASAMTAAISQDVITMGTGGPGAKGALKNFLSVMGQEGVTSKAGLQATIGSLGLSPGAVKTLNAEIAKTFASSTPEVAPKITPKEENALAAGVKYGQEFSKGINTGALGATSLTGASAAVITFKSKVETPTIPHIGDQIFNINGHLRYPTIPKPPDQSFTITGYVRIVGGSSGTVGSAFVTGGAGNAMFHSAHGMLVPGHGYGDIVPAMLEPGEAVVPKHLVPSIAPFLSANKVPGFALGGIAEYASTAGDFSPFGTLGLIRAAMTGMFSQILQALSGALSTLSSGSNSSNYLSGNPFMDQGLAGGGGGGGSVPRGTVTTAPVAVPVHIASVASSAAASMASGGAAGGGLPMPAAAQKILDAFEKTFAKMGSPWGQFATELINGLVANVRNPMKETAAQMTALTNQVAQEVSYGQNVAAAAKQGTGFNPWGGGQTLLSTFTSGLPQPTTTAQGQPYQYYTDQANISAGGTVSVQQQMSDYLQSIQSFRGDLGKLTKAGLNKNLMQQLIAAGPLQGDQEAQSILAGAGGVKGANSLWKQINAASNQLGISSAESVYGAPKAVKVSADVAAAQAAINSIHGKTVTIHVQVDIGSGGGGGGGASVGAGGAVTLSNAVINSITKQVQTKLLQQAKRNRRTGITLSGYGS